MTNYCDKCGSSLINHNGCKNFNCNPKENVMEKHGYTPLQQAVLLSNQLDELINLFFEARDSVDNVLEELKDNPKPDFGGMASQGLSDIAAMVNRASNTATCLQTLIMLAAIENNQL